MSTGEKKNKNILIIICLSQISLENFFFKFLFISLDKCYFSYFYPKYEWALLSAKYTSVSYWTLERTLTHKLQICLAEYNQSLKGTLYNQRL